MKTAETIIKYFLVYWFSLTSVPGLVQRTNDFINMSLASLGFAVLMLILPFVLDFFKLPKKNPSAIALVGGILTLIYTIILKAGIGGIIQFPQSAIFGDAKTITSLFKFELQEFGIILFVTVVSILLVILLDYKKK